MPRKLSQKPTSFVSLVGGGDTARVNVVLTRDELEILDRARMPPLMPPTPPVGSKDANGDLKPGSLSETMRRVIREWGLPNASR
jgi:hypothetical protein